MTRRVITSVPQIWRDAQAYINQRVLTTGSTSAFEQAKKPVRKWLKEHGETTDDGNIVYLFPKPIQAIDDNTYAGVELRCGKGQAFFDEEEVKDFFKKKKFAWLDRVFPLRRRFDPDALYVLHQEDLITEEELRNLMHYPEPSYSLWPVEAKVILEEEE